MSDSNAVPDSAPVPENETPVDAATAPPAKPPTIGQWWQRIAESRTVLFRVLLLVMLLAAGLRFHQLGRVDMWLDEGVAWDYSQKADWEGTLYYKFNHPPLYRLITRAVVILGGDEPFTLRLVPAVCGILLVPLIALIGRRLGLSVMGAAALGIFVAVNPMAVYLAQWHRHYSLAMLLAAWLTLIYFHLRARVTPWRVLHYALVLAAGMYTYYLFMVVPIAHGLAALFEPLPKPDPAIDPEPPAKPKSSGSPVGDELPQPPPLISLARWRLIGGLLASGIIAFILFAPWMWVVIRHMNWGSVSPLASTPTGTEYFEWLAMSFVGKRYHFRGLATNPEWVYYALTIFLPLLIGTVWCVMRRQFVLPLATVVAGAVVYYGFRDKYQLVDYYHFSPVLPLLIGLHGVGLVALIRGDLWRIGNWWKRHRASLAGLVWGGRAFAVWLLVLLGFTLFYGLSDQFRWGPHPEPRSEWQYHEPFRRAPWEQMAAYIRQVSPEDLVDAAPSSAVVVFPEYTDYVPRYLLRNRPVVRLSNYIAPNASPESVADDALNYRAQKPRSNPQAPVEFFEPIAATWPREIFFVVVEWEAHHPQVAALIGRLRDQRYDIPMQPDRKFWGVYRSILIWRAVRLPDPPPAQTPQ